MRCQRLAAGEVFEKAAGRATFENHGRDDLGIGLTMFSDPPGAELGSILPGGYGVLDLARPDTDRLWRIAITRGSPATVCG